MTIDRVILFTDYPKWQTARANVMVYIYLKRLNKLTITRVYIAAKKSVDG